MKMRKRFDEKVIKLVDVSVPNLWGQFNDRVLKTCDDVLWKKMAAEAKGIHSGR